MPCGILVLRPVIEPMPPAVEALDHQGSPPACPFQTYLLCNLSKVETFVNEKGKKRVGPLCFQVLGTGEELGSWVPLLQLLSRV